MPHPLNDLTGKRFGRLLVLHRALRKSPHHVYWVCKCNCGTVTEVRSYSLSSGNTISCGAHHDQRVTHGHASNRKHSPTYVSYQRMLDRCYRSEAKSYCEYGGRGIKVCKRWRDSFENFLADMGTRPDGKTIDRKNVNGNYTPSNCRWATAKQQQNNRRNNVHLR